MINWIKRLFQKNQYKPYKFTVGYILRRYIICEHQCNAMSGYIREMSSCSDLSIRPSKKIIKRYNMDIADINLLAWYLLEQYFEGNIEIKTKERCIAKIAKRK